jgi:organic hydroperoxide reductase OsmC/OhrA
MVEHVAQVEWKESADNFRTGRYSRAHRWSFDGGVEVPASSSPHVVRLPFSEERAVDPEEALVASISSCHMLTFLWLAHEAGWVVVSYRDNAKGILEKGENGVPWLARATLRPEIEFDGAAPNADALRELHHRAHHDCYIANSVRTEVVVEAFN